MSPTWRQILAGLALCGLMGLVACSGSSSSDGGTASGGTGATQGGVKPDFSLTDVNDTSPSAGDPVSPRDYLERVSAWYFAHAT